MVPFSFENIARSAGLDAPSDFAVSAAARATHESFESHLQRATAATLDPPTRPPARKEDSPKQSESAASEPPRQEPVRQDAGETRRDDADVRQGDAAEATTTTETSSEHRDEDAEQDATSEDEVVIVGTAEELRAARQGAEVDASGDSGDSLVGEAARKLSAAPPGDQKGERDAALATYPDELVDDNASASTKGNRVNSGAAELTDSETLARSAKLSETNEEVADGELSEETAVAEAARKDDEPAKPSTALRRGDRANNSANQVARETTDAATKPIAIEAAETTIDTAGGDDSGRRHQRGEAEGVQPRGNATPAEATTTTPSTPSRFAQHLLSRTDDPTNTRGPNITNADQARFVDRVARAMQATGEQGGTLRLRLSPPGLGALTLEVKVQGGVVSARVEADTPAARTLLLENLSLLRERLAEHGMRVDQFDVDLSDRHAGGTPDGLQQNDQQHEDRPRSKPTPHEPDDAPQATTNATPTKNGNEQLNIIV